MKSHVEVLGTSKGPDRRHALGIGQVCGSEVIFEPRLMFQSAAFDLVHFYFETMWWSWALQWVRCPDLTMRSLSTIYSASISTNIRQPPSIARRLGQLGMTQSGVRCSCHTETQSSPLLSKHVRKPLSFYRLGLKVRWASFWRSRRRKGSTCDTDYV